MVLPYGMIDSFYPYTFNFKLEPVQAEQSQELRL
jgi:hypothetical protein